MKEKTLWYGLCGYWTEDWSKLANRPGVPLCPICGAPGFVTEIAQWWADVERFEADSHPGYRVWLESVREVCFGRKPGSVLQAYEPSRGVVQ